MLIFTRPRLPGVGELKIWNKLQQSLERLATIIPQRIASLCLLNVEQRHQNEQQEPHSIASRAELSAACAVWLQVRTIGI
ncbi:MAG: hypothetical protein JWM11_5960 [Planctomycetaceae bacterium]|nr:hypothetical protein [Planctomycetaceae bacterium]